jgi:hypothetical protein
MTGQQAHSAPAYTMKTHLHPFQMLSRLSFDSPAQITPAVNLAVECLGGLELSAAELESVRNQVSYPLKTPRELTLADILETNRKLAAHFGVAFEGPANPEDFAEVAVATEKLARSIASISDNAWDELGCIDDFCPASHANTDSLLYGILHWSFDGNNLSGAAF